MIAVLTAASCVASIGRVQIGQINVLVGAYDIREGIDMVAAQGHYQQLNPPRIRYPGDFYNHTTRQYKWAINIAVVALEVPVELPVPPGRVSAYPTWQGWYNLTVMHSSTVWKHLHSAVQQSDLSIMAAAQPMISTTSEKDIS